MSWMVVAQVAFTGKEGSAFHGSLQATLLLHSALFMCLLRIWSDIIQSGATVKLPCRCVLCQRLLVCLARLFSPVPARTGRDYVAQRWLPYDPAWLESNLWSTVIIWHMEMIQVEGGARGEVLENMNRTKAIAACFCCLSLDRILFFWPFARLRSPFIC